MKGRCKRDIPEKTHRPAASSGAITMCENPGPTPPGVEPGSPRGEAIGYFCADATPSVTIVTSASASACLVVHPAASNLLRRLTHGQGKATRGDGLEMKSRVTALQCLMAADSRTLQATYFVTSRMHASWRQPVGLPQILGEPGNNFVKPNEWATGAEWLDCSPPTLSNSFDSRPVCSRFFACGNRVGQCRWSEGFLGDPPFLPAPSLGAAQHSHQFTLVGS
ncbi:hypothetical protein PR048_031151 [Dryococelus australis]|uniref:Uncharacterized protein n=1 Tax=Dryococelus australis TaxID=614101 RepID=A0ABQ9G4G6_9NEOP|nr:hypothetical protein PR048_031151 [Dryococelus australis]